MSQVRIYCDGSFKPNLGMGCGIYIENSPFPFNAFLYKPDEERASSPRAELIAMYYALSFASLTNDNVIIYSDCQYVTKTFNEYFPAWAKNGGLRSNGKEPKHYDLINPMYVYWNEQRHRITISHIEGHAGIVGNEIADRLAKEAASMAPGSQVNKTL